MAIEHFGLYILSSVFVVIKKQYGNFAKYSSLKRFFLKPGGTTFDGLITQPGIVL